MGYSAKKKDKKLSIFIMIIVLFMSAAVAVVIFGYVYIMTDIKGSDTVGEAVEVVIEKGASPTLIAEILQEKGIIKQAFIFRQYLKQTGSDKLLQYGLFTISKGMGYEMIIDLLKEPNKNRDFVSVTFPEGISALGFAMRMEEAGLCTAEEFLDVANNGDFGNFKFWRLIPDNPLVFMKADGYLFPDTYQFFPESTVYEMVEKIYANFEKNFTDDMYTRLNELSMSLSEFITLCSIVQREAGPVQHQADVAAVLHNRLAPNSPIQSLQCNVSGYVNRAGDNNFLYDTVAYFFGNKNSDDGWKTFLPGGENEALYKAYNTYECIGLPAGPICCPGIDAINNTLYYTKNSQYYFFVTDLAGKYYYGKTADEHAANINAAMQVNKNLE